MPPKPGINQDVHRGRQPSVFSAEINEYRRRNPQQSAFHKIIRDNFKSWQHEREQVDPFTQVPNYIQRDFEKYLECGVLACGFARAYCRSCQQDFIIAYSCKGRGVCPSCNNRRMLETSIYLSEQLFPKTTVRQFVLSYPKRLRYFLHRDETLVDRVLRIHLDVICKTLRAGAANASAEAKIGSVTFIQRFGSELNHHVHFHTCVIDGVFNSSADGIEYTPVMSLSNAQLSQAVEQIRKRTLFLFKRRKLLDKETVANMLSWTHSGFSLHAEVVIPANDEAGRARLFNYCGRRAFSTENLEYTETATGRAVRYWIPKARSPEKSCLLLEPLEFIERLSRLIPPPYRNRIRYHGVLAPNSPLRKVVTSYAGRPLPRSHFLPYEESEPLDEKTSHSSQQGAENASTLPSGRRLYLPWALLLARILGVFPLRCSSCKQEMEIISFINERETIGRILGHLTISSVRPVFKPVRGPPDGVAAGTDADWDGVDEERGFDFNQDNDEMLGD